MDIKLTEFKVVKWAEENSIDLGLSSLNIEANYIWNPGGFVNQSYRVSDGETVYHVKFAHARKAAHLQQWARISQQLEAEGFLEVKEITQKRAKEIHLHAYPEYLRHYI